MPKGVYIRTSQMRTGKYKRSEDEIKKCIFNNKDFIEKMRIRNTGNKHRLGRSYSDESKEKQRISQLRRVAEGRNNLYKGGISTYERKKWLNNQRRVKKMCNGGSHSLDEWEDLKKTCEFTCLCCKKQEPDIVLSRDHIIPLSKGGTDNIDNIQPLCRNCNSRKHDKLINYMSKGKSPRKEMKKKKKC